MTALMVLFLVAMAVALIAATQKLEEKKQEDVTEELRRLEYEQTIKSCVDDIREITKSPEFEGVTVGDRTINFGTRSQFQRLSSALSAEQQDTLRRFVPRILDVARTPRCERWFKRVVVEGFTSPTGTYLYNLNLSLNRAQRVLCVLLDGKAPDAPSEADRLLIRRLFLVGGSSFNSTKASDEESRRVELRLEFKDLQEDSSSCVTGAGRCGEPSQPERPLDKDDVCQI